MGVVGEDGVCARLNGDEKGEVVVRVEGVNLALHGDCLDPLRLRTGALGLTACIEHEFRETWKSNT